MRVALAQIDPTVGAIDANAAKIAEWIGRARGEGAELVIFPELCLPGYPAEDLYLKPHFVAANQRAVEELARGVEGITALVGFAEPAPAGGDFRRAYNSLAVLADGAVQAVYRKNRLPNYAVFDEQRYFIPGTEPLSVDVGGTTVGLTICEDCWVAGPAGAGRGRRGREADREPLGLALPPRQGARAGDDVRRTGARVRRLLRLLQPGRRPGRAGLRRPEPGRRPRRRGDRPRRPVRGGAAGLRRPRRGSRTARRAARRRRRGLRGAGPRPARLRRQERLPPRRPRPLGRDRFRPGGDARGRRRRPRAGQLRRHAVAAFQHCNPGGRQKYRCQPRLRADRDRDRADDGRLRARAGRPARPRRVARGAARSSRRATRRGPPSPTSPPRTSRPGSAAT